MLGLYNMAGSGLRTLSGVTVGLLGSAIGVHASLARRRTQSAAVT